MTLLARGIVAALALLVVGTIPCEPHSLQFKIIYAFQGSTDGANPNSRLAAIAGTLYGITVRGGGTGCGGFGCGTIFSVSPSGTETVLYRFQGGNDGANPESLRAIGDNLVGVSALGKQQGRWLLFSITPAGQFNKLAVIVSPVWNRWGTLTKVGKVFYGESSGDPYQDGHGCSGNKCGYVYSLTP